MKLSVIIPSYNRSQFLNKCVGNILQNSVSPFEIIVVDDCSKNHEKYTQVVRSLKENFATLRYIRLDRNSGAPKARNIGAAHASGDYLLFCDDDDYWYANHLEEIRKILQENPDTQFVYSGANVIEKNTIIDKTCNYFDDNTVQKQILKNCFISSPSICINREKFLQLGGFDEKFHSCQDWDMWTRVILDNPKIKFTGQITAAHVVHYGERIGFSKNAWRGYLQYYLKHLRSFFKFRKILILLHLYYISYHFIRRFRKR